MPRAFAHPLLAMATASLLAACGNYPRDVDGTLDRVRSSKTVRVGVVAMPTDPQRRAAGTAYLARVEAATGAKAQVGEGASETLLADLEHGKLDLVFGEFADDSPWRTDVAILEPLSTRKVGSHRIGLSPVARNGENAWIMLLERLARDGAGK